MISKGTRAAHVPLEESRVRRTNIVCTFGPASDSERMITGGAPLQVTGKTNFVRVERIP